MKNIKWIFVLYALAALASMVLIGFAIGAKSILGIIGAIVLLCAVMGFGFKTKKAMRDKGYL
ncbi:YlaF family protein [Bhargavaea cecembensis]|uniref:YlaF family protein n=1 Tax=Bhargavaea cecembensis TaxID=394098 RepID=UPI00058E0AC7|nr:YlaF family protein [Bhargavaea cecembensis]